MKALKAFLYSLIVLSVLFSTALAAPIMQEPPEILYVKMGGIGECSSWEDACDLQTAIGKLPDQIWVAAGTYIPTTTSNRTISFELESGLKIFGGFPPDGGDWEDRDWELHPTILSGDLNGDDGEDFTNYDENSYHVLTATDVNPLAKLDGFIITGGNADGAISESTSNGAGMYSLRSSPRLNNLVFTGNSSINGCGGLYNDQSSPMLINVTFSANRSIYQSPGGMANVNQSNPKLIDVEFINNEGSGMLNDNSIPTLTNVSFYGNWSEGSCGGMFNKNNSRPKLTDVLFLGNFADINGGGMCNFGSSPDLNNVSFIENTAQNRGGGIYNNSNTTDPTLTNVTFSGNSAENGGGMYNDFSSSTLINVTFFGNTATAAGGGIYNWSPEANPTDSINTILWGNTTDQIFVSGSTSPVVSYSVIQDGYPGGKDIITDDPLLGPLADNGGFTMTHALRFGSAAIDTGICATGVTTDQRGVVRPIGSGCDIGAVEYQPMIFLPLMIR